MNQDQSELSKFNAIADSWWKPDGPFRPLHDLNPIRLQWIASQVELRGKNVLDIGCGGGILSEALARENAQVTG
ncbi:MAG: bifunctional 3-demethylubiquinol 3-O-methyltransferase/2-polyprenyl-6-hydroxyphenol methylase, partial [Oxalobacter sp.]|nr:bifunctional 3-demethylubiquinol 3-O-methyltransferase/2-polyprenyl-6-hydroxyphenol methylase [Oxalobacter sp.]